MNYLLRDRVLFALLAMPEEQARKVVSLLDAIAAEPASRAQAAFQDTAGRTGYACAAGQFRIYYYVARDGRVTFTDLRQVPPRSRPAKHRG